MWPQCTSADGLIWWSSNTNSAPPSISSSSLPAAAASGAPTVREQSHKPLTGTREYYIDLFSDDIDVSPPMNVAIPFHTSPSTAATAATMTANANGTSPASSSSSASAASSVPVVAGDEKRSGGGSSNTMNVAATLQQSVPTNDVNGDDLLEGDAILTELRHRYRRHVLRSAIKSKSVPKTVHRSGSLLSPAPIRHHHIPMATNSIASPIATRTRTGNNHNGKETKSTAAVAPAEAAKRRSRHQLVDRDDHSSSNGDGDQAKV